MTDMFKVGDPDPTADHTPTEGFCMVEDPASGQYCTWAKGIKGDNGMHVAGNGSYILAVWPMESYSGK